MNAKPYPVELPQKHLDRFWSKVDIRGAEDCWEWRGLVLMSGYGAFSVGPEKLVASRLALSLHIKDPLSGKFACHHCDNPLCCNPTHLFAGSNKDNMMDASQKGRTNRWKGARRGERNPSSKLTENDVRNIREAIKTRTHAAVAAEFGVCLSLISHIKTGYLWAHVNG